jgi:hypothetical protein
VQSTAFDDDDEKFPRAKLSSSPEVPYLSQQQGIEKQNPVTTAGGRTRGASQMKSNQAYDDYENPHVLSFSSSTFGKDTKSPQICVLPCIAIIFHPIYAHISRGTNPHTFGRFSISISFFWEQILSFSGERAAHA